MKEELVSFEMAKLAKEKGFDILCNTTYNNIGSKVLFWYPNECFYGYCLLSEFLESLPTDDVIYAPTQSLLQKWLREVHKIECYVYPYRDHADDNNDPVRYRGHQSGMKMFNTFEEALENDLVCGLNKIKNEK